MEVSPQQLQAINAFAEVPSEQLQFLIDNGKLFNYAPGDMLFKPDEEANHMFIILSGKFEIYIMQAGNRISAMDISAGSITGVLPYSRMTHARGYGECRIPAQVLAVHKSHFAFMIKQHYELVTALVHHMTSRVRDFTSLQQQNEKLAALGKLSAGLAHELNNPASAIVRSSEALQKHLQHVPERFKKVLKIEATEEAVDHVNRILQQQIQKGIDTSISLMQRNKMEDELAEWLEEHGFDDGYELAENFVDFGFDIPLMDELIAPLRAQDVVPTLGWVNSNLNTDKMVTDIKEASKRIADLVQSVKAYTHMDQAPEKAKVEIQKGIKNTLRILDFKLKRQKVNVEIKAEDELPEIEIYESEFNQVWTNLLDNAIDALNGVDAPRIEISAYRVGHFLNVDVIDNGTGIPDEVKSKIFEPFFTTKTMGQGTGLGLDVVQRIVQRHRGSIKVHSQPGRTAFNICLPLQPTQ